MYFKDSNSSKKWWDLRAQSLQPQRSRPYSPGLLVCWGRSSSYILKDCSLLDQDVSSSPFMLPQSLFSHRGYCDSLLIAPALTSLSSRLLLTLPSGRCKSWTDLVLSLYEIIQWHVLHAEWNESSLDIWCSSDLAPASSVFPAFSSFLHPRNYWQVDNSMLSQTGKSAPQMSPLFLPFTWWV